VSITVVVKTETFFSGLKGEDSLDFCGSSGYCCGKGNKASARSKLYNRPLAKLGKAVKVTDTKDQRKAEGKVISAITIAIRKNTESLHEANEYSTKMRCLEISLFSLSSCLVKGWFFEHFFAGRN